MLTNLKKTNSKNAKRFAFAGIIAVLCVCAIIIQIFTPGVAWLFTPKAKAKYGLLEDINGVQHISDVPKGEIRYLINNNVLLKSDGSKGNFMFENPEACDYTLQFLVYEVVGDGNEKNLLYTSPMIKPGQFVSEDKLDKKLAAGKYDCRYFARAYLDEKYIGEKSGDITLTVLK